MRKTLGTTLISVFPWAQFYHPGDYANTSVIVGRTLKRHCASLFGQSKCSCVEDKLCVRKKIFLVVVVRL